MRRVILCLAAAAAVVGLSACDEEYIAVGGSDPPQLLVWDSGDKIDQRNINEACARIHMRVTKVQPVGNDRTEALVTCGPVTR